MRLVGGKKVAADLLELGGTDEDTVTVMPEEAEDMVELEPNNRRRTRSS
jgi:protein pelota